MPKFNQPPSASFEDILLTPADERWRRKFSKRAQEDLRKRSGEVDSNDRLTAIFYELMRDHVTPGVLQKLFLDNPPGVQLNFTNGWLAQYAEYLSRDVRNAPQVGDDLGPFYVNKSLLKALELDGDWRWLLPGEELTDGDVHYLGTASMDTDTLCAVREPTDPGDRAEVAPHAVWTFLRKVEKENDV